MSVDASPYQSPPEVAPEETAVRPRGRVWARLFWGAVGLTGIGFLANFMRNAPPLGFLLVAAVLFVITIIGSNPNRRRSIIGLVICLLITVFAVYQHRLTQARVARDRAIRAQRAAFEAAMAAEQAATREYERLMDQAVSSEVKE